MFRVVESVCYFVVVVSIGVGFVLVISCVVFSFGGIVCYSMVIIFFDVLGVY